MAQTLVEKILSNKSQKEVYANDLTIANIDFCMAQDGTAPLAIRAFREMEAKKVWDPKKIALVLDHSAPSPNEGVSKLHKYIREFAHEQNIKYLYDVGCGVCHQLLPQEGHVMPSDLVVGADSHTCTYGALGAFSTGVGSTDMAAVFKTGKLWFRVPETIKFEIDGKLPNRVYSKDLILSIIKKLTADGATYKAVEFVGETIDNLSVPARMTMSNMAIEMGAKAGVMPADEKVKKYLNKKEINIVKSDPDANFEKTISIDASNLSPQVACPHTVDNGKDIGKVEGAHIDQAFVGTCTNGRLEDLKIAAEIIRGKKVHKDVRMIVVPASQKIWTQALKKGLIETFMKAGAVVCNAGCGPCVSTHQGVLGSDEVCISTANRNFKGRMGSSESKIYLGSPATVTASAIKGEITDPRSV